MKIVHVLLLMAVALVAWSGATATGAEPTWQPTLEKGVDAAKRTGRPVFLVTIWRTGV